MYRRGPGLVRGVARTAVVAGTATAVSGNVARRQQARWAGDEPQAQPVEAAPEPMAAAPSMDQKVEDLEKLAKLKDQGILTEEEFQAQKTAILNS